MEEKAHCSALFIFNLELEIDDISDLGSKEIRRPKIPPDKIICVLIPQSYSDEVNLFSEKYGIPKDKIIFVTDTQRKIKVSYRDKDGHIPSCETPEPICIPDFEVALRRIKFAEGNQPIYTHVTRLPQ